VTTRGLILLDVDGVTNPWLMPYRGRRLAGYRTHHFRPTGWEHTPEPLRVFLHPDHGPMLLELAKATGWQLVWASTWEGDANRLIGPAMGLPELSFVPFGAQPATLRDWKFGAVSMFAGGRPLAWFDDDFNTPANHSALARFYLRRESAPTMLHHVSPNVGLTADDVHVVREWIQRT
jgi:Swiss Army Knife RNA repair-like protein